MLHWGVITRFIEIRQNEVLNGLESVETVIKTQMTITKKQQRDKTTQPETSAPEKKQQTPTRRERLKSALYLRLKKGKTFFFGKNLKFSKKISFGKCCTVPKNVKGGPFLVYKHAFCSKITKTQRGDPLWTLKKLRKKVSQRRKKIEGGGTLVPSGLVCNV